MDLTKEAFIAGYKQRAESSNLIFDNTSRMYAIELFNKWETEQLSIHVVSDSNQWTCEKCGTVPNKEVTFEETHDGCGGYCS
tara:strand:+ start:1372 stop:1617 length:246 start_codon:yes stop_codon:yes gene_type:complete